MRVFAHLDYFRIARQPDRTPKESSPRTRLSMSAFGDNASNEAKFRELRPYSVRKACIGSRREARQAGKMQANKAIKRRVRITAPITAGSVGSVP
jgi:hypothetical protein